MTQPRIRAFALCALVLSTLAGCLPHWPETPTYPELTVEEGEPLLGTMLISTEGSAVMKRVARNGTTETWMGQERVSLTLDRGVVVASRGLGFDLMGADAGPTLLATAGGAEGVYRRKMRYLTGDDRSTWINAACQITGRGPEVLDGTRFTQVSESCAAGPHRYTNLYWLDPQGRIRASRQWISPELGQIVLREQN